MSIIQAENALGYVFQGPAKPKKNKTRDLKAKVSRTVKGVPQVMVKITSFGGAGDKHTSVRAHLEYITRNGKLEAEDEQGNIISGKKEINDVFKDWSEDAGKGSRITRRDTMNMVLSMPEGTPPEAVRAAAREFAKANFGENYQYVFVLHTFESDPSTDPSPNPHVHLSVKTLGHDRKRLNPRKADLQEWRESFAEKMMDQGVEADASPRRSRGVVRKATKGAVKQINERAANSDTPIARVTASQIKDAADTLTNSVIALERPWEDAIRSRQGNVRSNYLAAAEALETSPDASDRALAGQIKSFVANMGSIDTNRHVLQQELAARFMRSSEKSKSVEKHSVQHDQEKDNER